MSALADMTINEVVENFEFLDEWDDRFRYLMELGRRLPAMDEAYKTEENRVQGCQSTVWLKDQLQPTEPPTIDLIADSNAHIVKGLIAILMIIFSGRTAPEILNIDAKTYFTRLGLDQHLSPMRRNGLHAMVRRIQEIARGVSNRPINHQETQRQPEH